MENNMKIFSYKSQSAQLQWHIAMTTITGSQLIKRGFIYAKFGNDMFFIEALNKFYLD